MHSQFILKYGHMSQNLGRLNKWMPHHTLHAETIWHAR